MERIFLLLLKKIILKIKKGASEGINEGINEGVNEGVNEGAKSQNTNKHKLLSFALQHL